MLTEEDAKVDNDSRTPDLLARDMIGTIRRPAKGEAVAGGDATRCNAVNVSGAEHETERSWPASWCELRVGIARDCSHVNP